MAIKANGSTIINDARELNGVQGYDSDVAARVITAINSRNHSFTIYNSAGTAIKEVAFAPPAS